MRLLSCVLLALNTEPGGSSLSNLRDTSSGYTARMSSKILIGLLIVLLLAAALILVWTGKQHHGTTTVAIHSQPQPAASNQPARTTTQSGPENHPAEATVSKLNPTDDSAPPPAKDGSNWKRYVSSEYNFELSYPADWILTADYENNYGKPPSGKSTPAYAGETRRLMELEMDGPSQSHEEVEIFQMERLSRFESPDPRPSSRTGRSLLAIRGPSGPQPLQLGSQRNRLFSTATESRKYRLRPTDSPGRLN
jgi:hypothetical protein